MARPRTLSYLLAVAFCAPWIAAPGVARADDEPQGGDAPLAQPWPPKKGERYPDLDLLDHRGQRVRLSDFAGKVIVVEPIGMSCPACQAFVGAEKKGAFRGVRPQAGLKSIEEYFEAFAKVDLKHKDVVYVQLLLYDMSARKAPTVEDAKAWAEHFGLDRQRNAVVLVGSAKYVNQASYAMIPGLQLIDRAFVLRSDSSGHHPQDNLYDALLPMVRTLLKEKAPRRTARPDGGDEQPAGEAGPADAAGGGSDPQAAKLIRMARSYLENGVKKPARRKLEEASQLRLSDEDRAEVERLLEESK